MISLSQWVTQYDIGVNGLEQDKSTSEVSRLYIVYNITASLINYTLFPDISRPPEYTFSVYTMNFLNRTMYICVLFKHAHQVILLKLTV